MSETGDGLTAVKCRYCDKETAAANITDCPVCELFCGGCASCACEHQHSEEEIEEFLAGALV